MHWSGKRIWSCFTAGALAVMVRRAVQVRDKKLQICFVEVRPAMYCGAVSEGTFCATRGIRKASEESQYSA